MSYTTQVLNTDYLTPYLKHAEPLFRINADNLSTMLPLADKVKLLAPLLNDEYQSVRTAADRILVTSDLPPRNQKIFDQAFKELIDATTINSWRGEGVANQGVLAIEMNKLTDAEKSFKNSIKIEPYFEDSYINLTDIYRSQQKPFQDASVLKKGIENNPKSAAMHYSYGLQFRSQKKLEIALSLFEKSMKLSPIESQYAYTFCISYRGSRTN